MRVVVVTLDGHLGNAMERVERRLRPAIPGLVLDMHPASDWGDDEAALTRCRADIARADIVICTMLFLEAHVEKVLPALSERAPHCDAFVGAMSSAEIVHLTRLGKLTMGGELKGPMALLKKLRGSKKPGQSSGAAQMKTLRRLPKILKFIPGTAQDLRVYFIMLQCWLAGSEENIACMVRTLVQRYARGERAFLRTRLDTEDPIDYPETGLYHPRMRACSRTRVRRGGRVSDDAADLPAPGEAPRGTVGLLMLRSYVLAENRRHYDRVIESLEARGLTVIPAFASGLDGRPAIDAYFREGGRADGRATIDCLVSLTGFSLVGGPAYNDSDAAVEALKTLDVPYLAAHPSEFQSLEQWEGSTRGLTPIETTMMVALPELDGATGPVVYAGQQHMDSKGDQDKFPIEERVTRLCERITRLVALRGKPRHERRLGIVLFNFPPNAGAVGTAAHLAVFDSLLNTLRRLAAEGYDVEVPDSVDTLRALLLGGNSGVFGTDANVLATVPTDDHVRDTPWLEEIEAQWGPAPGKLLTDGRGLFVLGAQARQGHHRAAAGLRLRRRSDAAPVRGRLRPHARLLGLLPLPPPHARRGRAAALRHPRRARVHARQAVGAVGAVLARAPGRRRAQLLLLRGQQPLRGEHRQAPQRGHPGQLPDADGDRGGAVQGSGGHQGGDAAVEVARGRRR